MDYVENQKFDEIKVGDKASISHKLSKQDIQLFAIISGDVNPTHLDDEYARSESFHKITAHSMWLGALISSVLGTQMPGPGTRYKNQYLQFMEPLTIEDTVTVTLEVIEKLEKNNIIKLDCQCINQHGSLVAKGLAEVFAPSKKVKRPQIKLPQVEVKENRKSYYEELIEQKNNFKPLRTGIVHPVDAISLSGVVESADEGLITPVLIGPEDKIREVAEIEKLDISHFELISTKHSHEAADKAVELVHQGKVEALMKGKLHTHEFMSPIVAKQGGLRTGRRMSHILVVDVPGYHKPLFITDAALNIQPNLSQKKDIVQNAIDLFSVVRKVTPKVAIVSAVETVDESIPSTLDATALCKMAERGQITGGILDGPLGLDNAISREAAEAKNIVSEVAGDADIIVTPDVEAGNMLTKQLSYLSGIEAPGIILGAQVPIILTSRAAKGGLTRQASCALALLYARHQRVEVS